MRKTMGVVLLAFLGIFHMWWLDSRGEINPPLKEFEVIGTSLL